MKTINIREGMRFGMGVDSVVERVCGEAIEHAGEVGSEGGQNAYPSVSMIESQESLLESLNISAALSARYGLAASLDTKMKFAQQHAVNEYSLYFLFRVEVENPPRAMRAPRLTAAAQAIYDRSPEEFTAVYGDTYIDSIYSGGEFYGLFTFRTRDESSKSEVAAELNGEIGNFLAGVEIAASFQNTVARASRKASMSIQAVMSGGSGLHNPASLDELRALYANFNVAVRDHPIDYKAHIKDFRYLPLPRGASQASRILRRDTIEACGRNVIEAIRQRGKLDYIIANPRQFEPFDLELLKSKRTAVNALAPRWAERAEQCSADVAQCSLEGLEPVTVDYPKRLAVTDPLDKKWEYVKLHDSRAAPYFLEAYCVGGIETYDEHDGGRYKIFTNNGAPIGGIFWHPQISEEAVIVYGGIFLAYMARGGCEGPLGYPRADEEALGHLPGWPAGVGDGLDRVSRFRNGVLWWDAQSGVVSDRLPRSIFDFEPRPLPRIPPRVVIRPGG
ncbi:LGFP repeat-containing protein [Caulobacter mirabilis]|uniref:Uncharacterized protein n=1 Tax=Caulobacter mirabilis TaxID=69666 RepID=A0A2D2AXF5_9CAUL|nr:hypothetical protein [Caulobacter mirabilis]ATQ42686.1 hypothetical protein CSW64_09810 [Caulobacter mirabilis]